MKQTINPLYLSVSLCDLKKTAEIPAGAARKSDTGNAL